MNKEDFFVPADKIALFSRLLAIEPEAKDGEDGKYYVLKEDLFKEVLDGLGWVNKHVLVKNESIFDKNEILEGGTFEDADSEGESLDLPQVIIEDVVQNGANPLKAIMAYHKLSLKEVALRYGGKSAAANLANYLAKTNEELNAMRPKTLAKIAEALDCPKDWIQSLIWEGING